MPSAKNFADAASRWADAGVLSLGRVFTPSLQAIGRDADRTREVAKYLAGLDPLGKACAAARRAWDMRI